MINMADDKKEPRYCTNCNFILHENEHFEDAEGNEYCKECKDKFEAIAGDMEE